MADPAHSSAGKVQKPYYELLAHIHRHLRPRIYVEVGVKVGRSLVHAGPETEAIAIDPVELPFAEPVHCSVRRFEMTSDDFFARHDLRDLCGPFDLAFIDGMHLFEFALRDFMNLERYVHDESVVLIHDAKPVDEVMAARERTTRVWSGDVWKVVPILREFRPDLDLTVVDVGPAGLAVVTRLDPTSTVLWDSYDAICERFTPLKFDAAAERALHAIADDWNLVSALLPDRVPPGSW
jgi:Methyltransferase domain